MVPQRTGIADIPVEVLIDNILPFCEVNDVVSLGCTNKFFALVTTDDTFWKRRLVVDYNFTGSDTARTSGWKFIYKRLRNPRVFVWGYVMAFIPSSYGDVDSFVNAPMRTPLLYLFREKDKGRLGLPYFPKTGLSDVPFPVELHLPGVRVVSLAVSGMSVYVPFPVPKNLPDVLLFPYNKSGYHALGADGSVHVWGKGVYPYLPFRVKISGHS